MDKPTLVQNGFVIRNLVNLYRWGGTGLKDMPDTLLDIIENKRYKRFLLYGTEVETGFNTLPDFCAATIDQGGLGGDKETLLRLCKGNNAAYRAVSLAYAPVRTTRVGRPPKTVNVEHHELGTPVISDNITNPDKPIIKNRGTSVEYGLERLSVQAPEEYAKVITGEKSVNAAMVDVGLKPRQFTIRADSAQAAAKAIAKRYDKPGLAALIEELKKFL